MSRTLPLNIAIKRVYASESKEDGVRILVDRLWPRGVSKTGVGIDQWLRNLAPSADLRKWFDHDPNKWQEFRRRYYLELAGKQSLLEEIRRSAHQGRVTLLYAARDEQHNNAVALHEYLIKSGSQSGGLVRRSHDL